MNDHRQDLAGLRRPAVAHGSWQRARRDLAEALAGGAGMIAVLGDRGTGKSLLLGELSALLAVRSIPTAVRRPSMQRLPDAPVDIVDDVGLAALQVFARDARPPKLRIIAIRADAHETLGALASQLRIIELGALDTSDVRTILEARLRTQGLPSELLTTPAVRKIHQVSGGNPAAIDRIGSAAISLAINTGASRILDEHIDQAMPRTSSQTALVKSVTYPSIVAELAALTAASESERMDKALRRRRYRVAAVLAFIAVAGAGAVASEDHLSWALDRAKGKIMHLVGKSSAGPSTFALSP